MSEQPIKEKGLAHIISDISDISDIMAHNEKITSMLPIYTPFDGDYDYSRSDELSRLATDLLGEQFASWMEVCLSYNDGKWPEWTKHPDDPPSIQVEATTTGDEWQWSRSMPIPEGWTVEQVVDLFQYGNIYFQPVGHKSCSGPKNAHTDNVT